MHVFDDAYVKSIIELSSELDWLKEHHPEKRRLIAAAELRIETFRQVTGGMNAPLSSSQSETARRILKERTAGAE